MLIQAKYSKHPNKRSKMIKTFPTVFLMASIMWFTVGCTSQKAQPNDNKTLYRDFVPTSVILSLLLMSLYLPERYVMPTL
jgi:hypothetical protein